MPHIPVKESVSARWIGRSLTSKFHPGKWWRKRRVVAARAALEAPAGSNMLYYTCVRIDEECVGVAETAEAAIVHTQVEHHEPPAASLQRPQ